MCVCVCVFVLGFFLSIRKERENVAESGLDCAGHCGHSRLRAALHALR